MDVEADQREHVFSVLETVIGLETDLPDVPRVSPGIQTLQWRNTVLAGLPYLVHARSLILLVVLAFLLSAHGPLSRRLKHLGIWCVVGLLLSAVVTHDRLLAEYHWARATAAAERGQPAAAQGQLLAAVDCCPAFNRLERTWLLEGQLDYRQGIPSPASQLFFASQLALNGQTEVAAGLTRDLLGTGATPPVAPRLLARRAAEMALIHTKRDRPQAAAETWKLAAESDPSHRYCRLAEIVIRTYIAHDDPTDLAGAADPLLAGLADRSLRAAILAVLGDAYYEAGRIAEARERYRASYDAYSLPKTINFPAQRGLLGM
jgi:tetratricopeptide (TPR) repeat protein